MFKMSIKFIYRNKKNTISIIMGIAFSVMLMFSLIQMSNSIMEKYKEFLVFGENQDFKINTINKEQSERIIEHMEGSYEDDMYVLSLNAYIAQVFFNENNSLRGILVAANESDIKVINNFNIIEGEYPNEPFEIAVEKSVNNKLENTLAIGDRVTLPIQADSEVVCEQEFIISGIMEDTPIQSLTSGERSFVFTTFKTIDNMPKSKNDNYSIDFLLNSKTYDEEKIFGVMNEMYSLINPQYNQLYENSLVHLNTEKESEEFLDIRSKVKINEKKAEAYLEKEEYSSIGIGVKLISLVIAISMVLLVFNSINLMVIEKIKQYGALRCIGMSKKQLLKIMLWEVVVYSLVGITIGILLGIALNQIVGENIMTLIVGEKTKLVQTVSSYIQVSLLAFISIFIASSKTFMQIKKMTPLTALNYCETNKFNMKNIKEIEAINQSKLINLFANRNIRRNKSKSITILISLTSCISLFMIIINSLLCIEKPEQDIKTEFSDYEIIQDFNGKKNEYISQDIIKEISKMPEVLNVYAMNIIIENSFKTVAGGDLPYIIGYNDNLFEKLVEKNTELRGLDYRNNKVAILMNDISIQDDNYKIQENMLKDNNILTGNILNILSDEKVNEKEINIKIDKVINGTGFANGGTVKISPQYLIINEIISNEIFENITYSDVMIDLKGGVTKEFEKGISSLLEGKEAVIYGAYNAGLENSKKQLLGMLFLACYMIVATALVGFLNMRNTIRTNIINRSRENGMLRAIGISSKMLSKVIYLENVKLTIYATICSLIIAIPICSYISYIMLERIQIKILLYILISISAILTSFFITYFEIKKSLKKSIISIVNIF